MFNATRSKASLLGARTLLGAPGRTTRNKKLLETSNMFSSKSSIVSSMPPVCAAWILLLLRLFEAETVGHVCLLCTLSAASAFQHHIIHIKPAASGTPRKHSPKV